MLISYNLVYKSMKMIGLLGINLKNILYLIMLKINTKTGDLNKVFLGKANISHHLCNIQQHLLWTNQYFMNNRSLKIKS
jgi:hypothetical protein